MVTLAKNSSSVPRAYIWRLTTILIYPPPPSSLPHLHLHPIITHTHPHPAPPPSLASTPTLTPSIESLSQHREPPACGSFWTLESPRDLVRQPWEEKTLGLFRFLECSSTIHLSALLFQTGGRNCSSWVSRFVLVTWFVLARLHL